MTKILHIFLKQLASILQGAIDGEDAIDPSDPPLNAKIQFGDSERKEKKVRGPRPRRAGDQESSYITEQ